MIDLKEINTLLSSKKMREVFEERREEIGYLKEITNVDIETIKRYIDWRSFSLVMLYTINKEKKIVGIANSDQEQEYAFQSNQFIFNYLSSINKEEIVPKPYCYIKDLGLFLEQFLEGKNFGKNIKKGKEAEGEQIKEIVKIISLIQKANIEQSFLKKGIDFFNIKNNISILKERREEEGIEIENMFNSMEREIREYEQENKVFVHGDLNPYNIFFKDNKIRLIDFGLSHQGSRVCDLANLVSHFETSLDFNVEKEKTAFLERFLINSYEKETGLEILKEEYETHKKYFNLLNLSHIMVWGDEINKRRISEKIKLINQ
jgi:thiamine kinase-like enzyme